MNGPRVVHFHGFSLDTGRRVVTRDSRPVHLTPKAFDLLTVLVELAPCVVGKDELHRRLWPETFVTDSTVAGVVKEIRRVLGDDANGNPLIRTSHGVGYAFGGVLETTDGQERGEARCWLVSGERRLCLVDGANDIGRDPMLAVPLDCPDASRRHARITLSSVTAIVEDLGSKNGTTVNDRPVASPMPLCSGDVIRIGTTVFVFHVLRTGASTETADGQAHDCA